MKKVFLLTAGFYISLSLNAQINTGLVAYYPFNSNTNDMTVNANNATLNGATLTTDRLGNANSAYSFDGVNDFINIPNIAAYNSTSYSVSLWYKYNGAGTAGKAYWSLISKNNSGTGYFSTYQLWINSSNNLGGRIGGGSPSNNIDWSTTGSTDDQWHQVTYVFDNTKDSIFLYLDGSEIYRDFFTHDAFINSDPVTIGVWNPYSNFFNGSIDEVRIYNRAISADDAKNLAGLETCNGIDDDEDGLIDETCTPTISIANKSLAEGNSDTTDMKFAVTLNHPYDSIVSVRYKTANRTANAGSDYVAINKVLKFNPGQVRKNITIGILGDVMPEPNEQFNVILSNPVNTILGTSDTALGTIRNDDVAFAIVSNGVDNVKNIGVRISPNPAKDQLHITGLTAGTLIQVMDLQGRVLLKQNISNYAPVNISTLTPGLYMLRYAEHNTYKTIKFIKE